MVNSDKKHWCKQTAFIESELLWALYWGLDWSSRRIGKEFDIREGIVLKMMEKYNIPRRTSSEARMIRYKPKYEIEPELLWALYWGDGYSTRKIAEIINCGKNTVYLWLLEYDIPRRYISEFNAINKTKIIIEPELLLALYWGNDYSIIKIASICNCSSNCIRRKLIKCRIRIKNINEWKVIGENHYNWIEDRSKLKSTQVETMKASSKWKEWRKQVFDRDDYTCQICHKVGGMLHPHHIKAKAKYLESIFDVENGITLYKDCHMWIHNLNPLGFQ